MADKHKPFAHCGCSAKQFRKVYIALGNMGISVKQANENLRHHFKVRISPLQRNVLHHLELNIFVYVSSLTPFERKPYKALQRKGLIQITTDDNGCNYWELKP